MLTEEQIREALRPLFAGSLDPEFSISGCLATHLKKFRAIEQAVRKEMEGDAKDAERWRWAINGETEGYAICIWDREFQDWIPIFEDEVPEFDAARGQT